MFTRRAVWRWPRTALWTGVSPSLARKSMWAPPSTRTRIASPPPGSHCTAKDRAVSGTHTHTHTDSNGVFNGQKDWFGSQTIRTTLARLFAPSRSLSGKTVSTIQVNYLHSNSLEVILLNTCSFVLTGSTKTHFIQPQSRHPGHSDGVWLIFSALWVSEQSVLRNSESAEKWNSGRKKIEISNVVDDKSQHGVRQISTHKVLQQLRSSTSDRKYKEDSLRGKSSAIMEEIRNLIRL